MSDLDASGFPAFYRAVHGHAPFRWQTAMVEQVLREQRWPDLVDVPTGLGKTSMLDIAVYVAAATAHLPGPDRPGRRRVFFVVDRRIVVDEAFEHAQILARALADAEHADAEHADAEHADAEHAGAETVVGQVVAALRTYSPGTPAAELVSVTRMRGGTSWDAAWLDRPDRLGLVLATVDQVGSRLLFRGYGVSDRRRPLDAALIGTDSLLLVDEAHLSTALLSTVAAAQERDRLGLPVPGLGLVRLSATGEPTEHTFTLDAAAHRQDPEAWRRLTAGKRLQTRTLPPKEMAPGMARLATGQITELAAASGAGWAPTVLIVCNTVDGARAVHEQLQKLLTASDQTTGVDCELLIGRSRPVDRPLLQNRVLRTFGTRREPRPRPAVLVATQTVEVGLNIDADVLISESASWDALVQRLGRLNRLGRFTQRFPTHRALAVIVHDDQADGPVYGAARDRTWQILTTLTSTEPDGVNVSPLHCRRLSQDELAGADCRTQTPQVPILQTPTLDTWAQTAPIPMDDVEVQPFLHGFDSGAAGVLVAWRTGLRTNDDPFDDPFDDPAEGEPATLGALLAAVPVRPGEQVEVPFIATRTWMAGGPSVPVADVEAAVETEGRPTAGREPFRVLSWRHDASGADPGSGGSAAWRWIDAGQLRPGDQIVAPTDQGGLDRYGWNPTSTVATTDVSDAATFAPTRTTRALGILHLDDGLPGRLGIDELDTGLIRAEISTLIDADTDPDVPSPAPQVRNFCQLLAGRLPDDAPDALGWSAQSWHQLTRWLATEPEFLTLTAPRALVAGQPPATLGYLLVGPLPDTEHQTGGLDRDDDDVLASSISAHDPDHTGRVTLEQHHHAVRTRAADIAAALGFPAALAQVVQDAAGWHDLGKLDERFQTMLHGGDAHEAMIAAQPLAKSGMDPGDKLAWRRARISSGLPAGARHEAWSAALVEQYLQHRGEPYPGDADLLLHLVASHHGHARPLMALISDPDPRPIHARIGDQHVSITSATTVDLHQPARFAHLNARYGRWGLALLEAVVRCADTTVSAEGS